MDVTEFDIHSQFMSLLLTGSISLCQKLANILVSYGPLCDGQADPSTVANLTYVSLTILSNHHSRLCISITSNFIVSVNFLPILI